MKKLLLLFIVSISCLGVFAQPYGNEWINYSQPHFKFEVSQEGMHQITSSVINQYGLNFIAPENFKVFRDGVEIPIYVQESNGVATSIEFYAYPNDGKLDTRLFNDPNWQMHDRYSLFTDNAVYYLTWNEAGNNSRLVPTLNDLTNLPAKEDYFFYTSQSVLNDAFSIGEPTYFSGIALYNSLFSNGEGFYSNLQFNNTTLSRTFNIPTANVFAGIDAEVYTVVVSWTSSSHHFRIKSGNTVLSEHQFNDYNLVKTTDVLSANQLAPITPITFEAVPTSGGSTNRNNASLIEIKYPRNFDFNNQSSFVFEIEGNGADQLIEIENLNEQNTFPILYDVTNGYRIVSTDPPGSSTHSFKLPPASGTRKLLIRSAVSSTLTNVASMEQLAYTNFNSLANQGDYILLSHSSLLNSSEVNAYISHRSGFLGGNHNVVKVDVQQIYDQFGYGIDRHPQAIRNFVDFITDTWPTTPKHMFIVGKGREYKDFRNNSTIRDACLIPTFGNPGSDILLGSDENSAVPKIAIGRLAATNTSIIDDYLEKIIEYDNEYYNFGDPYQTIANKDYMKQIIHLGGGTDLGEQSNFRAYLNGFGNVAKSTSWGANTSSVFKNSSAPIQTLPSELIRNRINDGVSLITFFGHSYAGGFDLSFDDPENYSNQGKYPIFIANGCNSGLIHAATQSISERFVFQAQKGAIAYLSTTDLSSAPSLNNYTSNLYENFSNSHYASSLGKLSNKLLKMWRLVVER